MLRKISIIIAVISLGLALTACTAKLTTIRPTLIDRIVVADIASGTSTEHQRKTNQELDWLMDDLVFMMERQYRQTGKCADEAAHVYDVDYYMGEKLELSVSVHSDGSICRNGRLYLPSADAGADPSADLELLESFAAFDAD